MFVVALLALVGDHLYFRRSRTRKTLDWDEMSNTALVHTGAGSGLQELQVLYGGEKLVEPRIVVVALRNTGNTEVSAEDYVEPPTFAWSKCRVVGAEVAEESTPGILKGRLLRVDADGKQSVWIKPAVLNAGEWIDLQFVVDGPREWPAFTARFKGQTRPPEKRSSDYDPNRFRSSPVATFAGMLLFSGVLILGAALFGHNRPAPAIGIPIGGAPIVVAIGLVLRWLWVHRDIDR